MNKSFLIVISILLSFHLLADWDYKTHDGSDVYLWITNFNQYGHKPQNLANCEWPRGSGHTYLWGGGLWFGSISRDLADTTVTVGFDQTQYRRELVPGLVRQGTTAYHNPYVRVYIYPEDWPPPIDTFPMAPQVPLTFEDSWCCYNDADSTHHSGGHPLGIEVYQSGYADPRCPDAIFLRWTIKNLSPDTIYNWIAGIFLDFDIGDPGDDMAGFIWQKWFEVQGESIYIPHLPFGYDYDFSVPGWDTVGVIGLLWVETPESVHPHGYQFFQYWNAPQTEYDRYYNLWRGPNLGPDSHPNDKMFLSSVFGWYQHLPPDAEISLGCALIFALSTLEDTIPLVLAAKRAREFYWQNIAVEEVVSRRLGTEWGQTITTGEVIVGEAEAVAIFDVSGRLVRMINRPHRVIHLESLRPGIYFMRIQTKTGFKHEKILILK